MGLETIDFGLHEAVYWIHASAHGAIKYKSKTWNETYHKPQNLVFSVVYLQTNSH